MGDGSPRSLGKTTSLCPVCLQRIEASITAEKDEVFLDKSCENHGQWKIVLWRGEPRYEDWIRPKTPAELKILYGNVDKGCPFDCGLCEAHRQYPCSVLLEITKRCQLTCPVCFADAGRPPFPSKDPDMKTLGWWYDRVVEAAGPCNIQLSGGEPTLRDDLPRIIALGREKGFSFIQVNTNGLRLASEAGYARSLREAGLATVFLQFDGTEDAIYSSLRGQALLREKTMAIDRCGESGLGVVLVPTLVPGVNTEDIGSIIRFAIDRVPVVRRVHFQPISYFGRFPFSGPSRERITLPEVMEAIEKQTAGLIKKEDFLPPGTENARCSFHGSFILMADGRLRCTTPSLRSCCSTMEGNKGLQRTISTVAHQWSAPSPKPVCCPTTETASSDSNVIDLDTFLLRARNYSLSISCMAFQDVWNLDMERLRDCCISIMSPDGRLIPFCAYNLTGATGETLYRKKSARNPA
jgi:uncharacterized radical SAM superfamily Fe-S cluster-containing enzyme